MVAQDPLIGETDGAIKYAGALNSRSLWEEKLRQEWFEDTLGLMVLRYIDREARLTPDALYGRFERKTAAARTRLWTPPHSLEIFQSPLPGTGGGIVRIRRNGAGAA
jgi:hypothetical protein